MATPYEDALKDLLKQAEDDLTAARAENERLTKERDEAATTVELVNSNNLTLAAELAGWKQLRKKAEAERDEARAQVGALLDENARLNAAMLVLGAYLMEKGEAFRVGEGAELLDAYSAALTPADTKAALEARDREKMREGMQRAAEIIRGCCPECQGTGLRDSGGVQPRGEPISVPCDCTDAILA